MLTKEQIIDGAAKKNKSVTIVPTSIGDIGIRVMSGLERETYEAQIFVDGKVTHEHLRAKLLAKVICDENGVRLFSDDDIASVSGFPSPVLIDLFDVAQKVNALTKEDVEELVKN